MKQKILILATAILLAGTATAQDKGFWRASNSTAQSVTGDVGLSDTKFTINFFNFPIVHARDLAAGEVSSVFDADSSSGNKGNLYKLDIPATRKFVHKNTLCGAEAVQWLVTYAEGNTLHIAFFSGDKPPVFTLDAISNSTDLCGTFSYIR